MIERAPLPVMVAEQRAIAVMRRLGLSRVQQVAPRLHAVGLTVCEITLDGDEAIPSIRWLAAAGFTVGAGTVLSVESAAAACDAGAEFLVSPRLDPELVTWSMTESVPVVPGGLTPSELAAAWELGASAVKLFPASLGGPAYLRAIREPLGDIPVIPTGGVSSVTAADYLCYGALAVGIGGWLTAHEDLEEVSRRAAQLAVSVAAQG